MLSLSKDKIKILLLEGISENVVNTLKSAGYTSITYYESAISEDELIKIIPSYHFIGIRSRTHLNDKVLKVASKLIAIGCFCIGTNQVDLITSSNMGIPIFNAPFSNTRSVAELVLAEAILLLRQVPSKNTAAHSNVWLKSANNCFEARNKVLGIIGYGHIGTQLGIIAENIGFKVIFYDLLTKLPLGNARQVSSLNDLLSQSDVVSLHVPETNQTHQMITKKELDLMKKGSVIINAARGNLINIEHLKTSLDENHLLGAAIDVFPIEPENNQEKFQSILCGQNNVILTPHIGGSTQEAQIKIADEVAHKLIKYSDNGSTITAVNFPEVNLPHQKNCSRVIHVHQNIPGILNQINAVCAAHNINILAQYLQTKDDLGYVVFDLDITDAKTIYQEIQSIQGTLKTRILH